MAVTYRFEWVGMTPKELQKRLVEASRQQLRGVHAAVRETTEAVAAAARANIAEAWEVSDPGAYAQAAMVSEAEGIVFSDARKGLVPVYAELGTRPHEIEPREASVLRFEVGGEVVFARRVQHPGTAPTLYMSKALEAEREAFVRRLRQALALHPEATVRLQRIESR